MKGINKDHTEILRHFNSDRSLCQSEEDEGKLTHSEDEYGDRENQRLK